MADEHNDGIELRRFAPDVQEQQVAAEAAGAANAPDEGMEDLLSPLHTAKK